MVKMRLTKEELIEIIEKEGLEYSIEHYLTPGRIGDDEVRAAWIEARKAIGRLNFLLHDDECSDSGYLNRLSDEIYHVLGHEADPSIACAIGILSREIAEIKKSIDLIRAVQRC